MIKLLDKVDINRLNDWSKIWDVAKPEVSSINVETVRKLVYVCKCEMYEHSGKCMHKWAVSVLSGQLLDLDVVLLSAALLHTHTQYVNTHL